MIPAVRPILLKVVTCLLIACGPARLTPVREPTPLGTEMASTIDPKVQIVAREEIDRAVAEWHPAAAVAIVLEPATGAILAVEGRDMGRSDPMLASHRAYVTGSTLKTFTIAAALDAGTIALDSRIDCATRYYGAKKLFDAEEHGSLSITEALVVSSNVGASRVYDTLGLDRMVSTLQRFHIGDPPASLPSIKDGSDIEAAMFAAGELAKATPMQIAAAYAAIFNGGIYVAPTFARARQAPERVLKAETAKVMVNMLEAVVTSDLGTGKLARVDGVRVAGKPGTADGPTYASFVGTALDPKPKFVVLVGLVSPREGGTGPSAAAPTFARIVRRLLCVDRGSCSSL